MIKHHRKGRAIRHREGRLAPPLVPPMAVCSTVEEWVWDGDGEEGSGAGERPVF